MNLIIKAERFCAGCSKRSQIDLEVCKVEAGLMFVDWSDYHYPEGWVMPQEWNDKRLQNRQSYKDIDHSHLFCSTDCMYNYYEA